MLPPGEDGAHCRRTRARRCAGWPSTRSRQEVRLVVAVLRDGSRGSALRMRSHDDETGGAQRAGPGPGLAEALAATLAD